MVIAGTLFGACMFFFGECDNFPNIARVELWQFLLCIVLGLFMIPAWPGIDIRGWGETNSLNGPNWSLTFEYIGNILYAFVLRRLPTAILGILCFASIFLTLNLALGWDVFDLFATPKYDVIGGWSLTADQILVGFSRLLYPFLCGLLISRLLSKRISADKPSGSPLGVRGGFWWASLMLIILLAIPQIGGKPGVADGLYQVVAIVVLFPIVVLIGAGSKTTDARSTKWCDFLGQLSYPLYIIHYPLMYMQMAWVSTHMDAPAWQHIALNIGVVVVSIATAWAWLKLYDEPVRAWLRNKLYSK